MVLNIVMPIAGAGQRFKDAGYDDPKPLIKIDGIPMWEMVAGNVLPKKHESIFHLIGRFDSYGLPLMSDKINTNKTLYIEGLTEGAACTVLLVADRLDNYDPLLIVNGDQYIEGLDIDAFLDYAKDYHGCIMTFDAAPDDPPKWSYVKYGSDLISIAQVAEKKKISSEATCGIYYFRHGRDFLRAASAMITKNIRTNGEFYLCPVYNEMIAEGLDVGAWNVNDHGAKMHGLGTPEDLEKFLAHRNLSKRTG